METFLLKENVLTDNILEIPTNGYIFKGGYIGRVTEYTFETSWSDKQTVKKFKSKNRLLAYLKKHYNEALQDFDFSNTCLF